MKPRRRSILAMLDDTVRWTGMPAGSPLRCPMIPIASIGHYAGPDRADRFLVRLLMISLAWPPALDGFSLGGVIGVMRGILGRHLGNDAGHPHERAVRKTFVGR